MIIWIVAQAAVLVLVGIAYMRGKCDGFIAGYNTSSPQKQKQYDIRRLRLIVACFHFALAPMGFIFLLKDSALASNIFIACVTALSVAAVILANTWARKRSRRVSRGKN